ncbi:MAG: hypothetical protein ABIT20_21815 [Gemmatimonadaceae bacterium]
MSTHSFDRQPRDGSSSNGSHQSSTTARIGAAQSPRRPAMTTSGPASERAVSQADGAA